MARLREKQREEREELKKFLARPHAREVLDIAHYARRLERRLDEARKGYKLSVKEWETAWEIADERAKRSEAGASLRWESESLAFRTALKVLNLDAEALLQRYLPGARDFLLKNDPTYGGALKKVAVKTVADPTDVLVHTTEKDMTNG